MSTEYSEGLEISEGSYKSQNGSKSMCFFWVLNSLKMALGFFDFNDAYVLRVKMKSKPAIKKRSTQISHMNHTVKDYTIEFV